MDVAELMFSLQTSVLAVDGSDTIDSPVLKQSLSSSGYEDSIYMVEEWKADLQQVLETWEVLQLGLTSENVQARYDAFSQSLPDIEPERAIEIESSLISDAERDRTTAVDRPLVKQYQQQLNALIARLGALQQ